MEKRILVIDDDIELLEILDGVFTRNGFQVETVTGTNDIFKTIKERSPDLIVVDYLLEGVNGGDICAQIKKNPFTCAIPVVLMTAFPRVLLSLGTYQCDEFIEKPFDLDHLVNRVQYYSETPVISNNIN
ncbi:two-component system response regulator [Mucilaginibacter sp. UR6-11]|uniref:response regulator n=1 Tax=Mucilaginibacter sp. UR6-11 TaxID=1435644 RepID=UPI001E30F72E|nr:response regulator [Mucilaginibacter sp. UR6-11]MCC8425902.1 response regulator [Mucilaginibacter sp. UR6-11]